ncbi:N-acetyltransferase [Halobacteriales archaeon SW_7_65_23]|nr:MAG: N-acetyltransferase [Halobacteriales archaeon SW_7_65_23]
MPTVRPARPADRDPLREIQREAIAEPWPALLDTALKGPPPLYVIEDRTPVGYAIVIPGESIAYIPELAVHPSRHGEGLGSQLLAALCDAFDDRQELRVIVRAVDTRARSFYEHHGFEPVERVPDHFEAGDGIVLRRALGLGAGDNSQ